ncbi:hypothetical protein H0H87_011513 [Tephrocybe sp. NHM501043]|nr:hypothetical protein H0H87_011513 [Tephrocybe sp. NHM501043]
MPVTEIATFQVLAPKDLHSEPIASLLTRGIHNQITYSSTPVYLFTESSDASSIYLISGWPSIERHHESGGSDVNKEVMSQLVPTYVTFRGLAHPSIDFGTFPSDVSVVVVEKGVEASEAIKGVFATAQWAHSEIDENNEHYRLSAYGPAEAVAILEAAGKVEGVKGVAVLKRAISFGVGGTRQVV